MKNEKLKKFLKAYRVTTQLNQSVARKILLGTKVKKIKKRNKISTGVIVIGTQDQDELNRFSLISCIIF